MTFDWGYLVVLAVVFVMLVVFRQLDKNNRSLEKIRKFAETVRHDLNVKSCVASRPSRRVCSAACRKSKTCRGASTVTPCP